ncbi:MAG TPA: 6-bladed beta-propeller [Terriglobales bacterium]|nr:6-bladed beta-propeller [Terriglobales bacterium]
MLRSFCRSVVCVVLLLLTNRAYPQELARNVLPPGSASTAELSARESPRVSFQLPSFAGIYSPDGTFRKPTTRGTRNRAEYAGSMTSPYASGTRPAPAFMDLHSIEHVVQNFEPPAHATEQVKGHSIAGNLRDSIVTFAYGREWVLMSPTDITTDSHDRLIIADPSRNAVHVLEPKAKNSFRIAGGPKLRLHSPTGVAVDKNDNIYVSDSDRGTVLVFNPEGHYLRTIGQFSGESMFQTPDAIAIDRTFGHLYVIDKPMREIFILDLSGRLLTRVGGPRDKSGKVRFDNPVDVAVGPDRIVVLDAGLRILVLGLYGEPIANFPVPNVNGDRRVLKNGVALDSAGNIYLSNPMDSTVEILAPDGRLLGIVGHPGIDEQGFNRPSGIWIDAADRMYVSDTANRRVQLFQVNNPQVSTARTASGGGN